MELRSIHRGGKEKQVGTFLNVGVFSTKGRKKEGRIEHIGDQLDHLFPLIFYCPR